MTAKPKTCKARFNIRTMRTKDLQHELLSCGSWAFWNGIMCDLKHKRIGPGVYDVWLEERPEITPCE